MTDTENRLRSSLTGLAGRMDDRDLVAAVVTRGRRARRRRMAVAGTASAAAVAIVVGVTMTATSTRSPAPSATHRPTPSIAPSPPHDLVTDAMFRVPAPQLEAVSGPAPLHQRPCRPHDVTARAELRTAATGVVGVVAMQGRHCSLRISPGPTQLLDRSGHPLALVMQSAPADVGENIRPDIALGAGGAAWGFAWRGSWCGPAAAAVVVPLRDDPDVVHGHSFGRLVVPLTGASPGCAGRSDAVLVRGVPGWLDASPFNAAVLPPPPVWHGLRLALHAASVTDTRLGRLTAVIRNVTGKPIALDPCPNYDLVVTSRDPDGVEVEGTGGQIGCPAGAPAVVPAHGSRQFALRGVEFHDGGTQPGATHGSLLHVAFGIAGAPVVRTSFRAP